MEGANAYTLCMPAGREENVGKLRQGERGWKRSGKKKGVISGTEITPWLSWWAVLGSNQRLSA
jgi:hypothetical protein